MKKLRIEIDAPETCGECQYNSRTEDEHEYCNADIVTHVLDSKSRPEKCKSLDVETYRERICANCNRFEVTTERERCGLTQKRMRFFETCDNFDNSKKRALDVEVEDADD